MNSLNSYNPAGVDGCGIGVQGDLKSCTRAPVNSHMAWPMKMKLGGIVGCISAMVLIIVRTQIKSFGIYILIRTMKHRIIIKIYLKRRKF